MNVIRKRSEMKMLTYILFSFLCLSCRTKKETNQILQEYQTWRNVKLYEIIDSKQVNCLLENKTSIIGEYFLKVANRNKINELDDIKKKDIEIIKKNIFKSSHKVLVGFVYIRNDSDTTGDSSIDDDIISDNLYYFSILPTKALQKTCFEINKSR